MKGNNESGRKQLVQDIKFSVCNAVKAYMGSEAIRPLILNVHTRCVPAALLRARSPRYPLNRTLCGIQRLSGRFIEKNILSLLGIEL
jgi:hypothetical protein